MLSASVVWLFYVVVKAVRGGGEDWGAGWGGQSARPDACSPSATRAPRVCKALIPIGRPRVLPTLLGDLETRSPRRSITALEFSLFQNCFIVLLLPTFYDKNIQTYSKVKGILQ